MNSIRRPIQNGLLGLSFLAMCIACSVLSFSNEAERVPVQQWLQSRGPVVPHDTFPSDCKTCHEGGGWHTIRVDFRFDHEKQAGLRLLGAHQQAECLRCHNDRGSVAKYVARGCTGCHEPWHKGQLGTDCKTCHDEKSWQPKQMIAKHNMTRFALVGAHAGVACWACHPGAQVGEFKHASTDCVVCHRDQMAQTTAPNHVTSGWTTECQRCHSPIGWQGAAFVHSSFVLSGAHKSTACTKCHINGVYRGTPRDCISCHQSEYSSTSAPNHSAAGFSTACSTCHNTSTWQGATFAHTSYALTGAHTRVNCSECHQNNIYQGTPNNCIDCHTTEYNATTTPNHPGASFSTDCTTCHNTTTWQGATFAHTTYPLTGAHVGTSCSACHQNKVYQGTPNNCVDCHLTNYNATTNPNHQSSGFATSCQSCHNTTQWEGATFNHSFPRTGHHNVSCSLCHTTPNNQTAFSCLDCHDHRKSKMDDKHKSVSGYSYSSPACLSCHPNGKH